VFSGFDTVPRLVLPSAFLGATGFATLLLTRRWSRGHDQLQGRLAALERELEDVRAVGRVGENVARMAHGLKNAVHSLRGLSRLIAPEIRSAAATEALEALSSSIARLEELVRSTLGVGPPADDPAVWCTSEEAHGAIRAAASEIAQCFPELQLTLSLMPSPGRGQATPELLRELSLIVLRNAAESMQGRGRVELGTHWSPEFLEVVVRDRGPGFPSEPDFRPGRTSKREGSGFGLFLARRVLEQRGGQVVVAAAAGGGARVAFRVPVAGGGDAQHSGR
jgi:signal transduction histidine kinase